MPKVSVIIPCYNQGQYVDEAVDSVLGQTFQDFEIIIVNDGSTDEYTNEKLKNYNKPKTRIIHTTNQGLAAARNNGIKASCGEYILPLDADDRIGIEYLEKTVEILDSNNNIGIVYCEAEYFGEKTGKWHIPDFSIEKILSENLIFCSAFFRRNDYDKTIGYNSNMLYGWEDWDFWLTLIEHGIDVHKINITCFFYRIKQNSMTKNIDVRIRNFLYGKIYENHNKLYQKHFPNPIVLLHEKTKYENEVIRLNAKLDALYKKNHSDLLLLESFSQSIDYKIGHALLKPFRYIKRSLK